jgi:hypothetical protein
MSDSNQCVIAGRLTSEDRMIASNPYSAILMVATIAVAASMFDGQIEARYGAETALRQAQFEMHRNAEIEQSIAAYKSTRVLEFAKERNGEIETSIARVEAARQEAQRVAIRNAEIEQSIAAYRAARAISFAAAARNEKADRAAAVKRAARTVTQTAEMEAVVLKMKTGGAMSTTGAIAVFERLASLR